MLINHASEMSEPAVSIITPSYNAEKTLRLTADSVFAQTFSDWEWIIVDDGSQDNTAKILRCLSDQDTRLRLIANTVNEGPAKSRQKALSLARARYIVFLDADDLWLPEKLERQIRFMQDKNVALSFTSYRRINEDGRETGRLISVPSLLTYSDLLKNTAIANSTVIVDRIATGDFSIIDVPYEDYATWLSLLKRGFVAYGMQDDLMRYRVSRNSDSSNKWRGISRVWYIYRQVEEITFLPSVFCISYYAWRALLKRLRF